MKTMKLIFASIILAGVGLGAQGIVNNGAQLVLQNSASVIVSGSSGNYLSQSGGVIKNSNAGGTLVINGNWTNNAGNAGFFNDGASVILAGANQQVNGSSSTVFYNLSLQGSGTKTLGVNTTVGGQSLFNGVLALGPVPLDLNQNMLTISNASAGAITQSGGYIISETASASNPSIVRWIMGNSSGSYTVPFGIGGSLIPLTFNVTVPMPGAADYTDFSTRATAAPDNQPWATGVTNMFSSVLNASGETDVVIDRWWSIVPSAAVTADLTFTYRGIENTLAAPYTTGTIGAQHWLSSLQWDIPAGAATAVSSGTGTVTAPAQSSFSDAPWILSAVSAPLPVELMYFNGSCNEANDQLSWATASEQNNDYFTILKSIDGGLSFFTADTVNGNGTSTQPHYYHWTDPQSSGHPVYYQLRQTDFNGQSESFSFVYLDCEAKPVNGLVVSPNPGDGNFMLGFTASSAAAGSVEVYDSRGRKVLVHSEQLAEGNNSIPLVMEDFAPGIYFICIQFNETRMYSRFILQ